MDGWYARWYKSSAAIPISRTVGYSVLGHSQHSQHLHICDTRIASVGLKVSGFQWSRRDCMRDCMLFVGIQHAQAVQEMKQSARALSVGHRAE